VVEAVEQGSRAVERIQLETARHRFGILAHVPVLATAAGVVHQVHDAAVTAVHASVRGVSRVAGTVLDIGLAAIDTKPPTPGNATSSKR